MGVHTGKDRTDEVSAGGLGSGDELTTHGRHTFAHALEAVALAVGEHAGTEAVVGHLDHDDAGPVGDGDLCVGHLAGVLEEVGQGLLHHPVGRQPERRRDAGHLALDPEMDAITCARHHLGDVLQPRNRSVVGGRRVLGVVAQDADDAALFDAVRSADDGFRIPATVANAIVDGEQPVKAWREHHGLTQEALSEKAGISKAYLCQIETRKRVGALKTLKALADALVNRGALNVSGPLIGLAQRMLDLAVDYAAQRKQLQVKGGVLVQDVAPRSRAEQAGLQEGDVIVSLGNQPVDSVSSFNAAVAKLPADKPATVLIQRGGMAHYGVIRPRP